MGNELNSTRLRFGPIAVAAAVLGLALGLAMPVSPVAAGVQSDRVAIDGIDVRQMRIADLRRNIAIVSQDTVLFNDTIYHNLLLTPEKPRRSPRRRRRCERGRIHPHVPARLRHDRRRTRRASLRRTKTTPRPRPRAPRRVRRPGRGRRSPPGGRDREPAPCDGEVEVHVERLDVLNTAPVLPFQLDDDGVDETLRLHHRYLDLRRDSMRHNVRVRFALTQAIRRYLEERGFWELETPILYKSTPEGAREFLVPTSRTPAASMRFRSRRRPTSSSTSSPASSATTRSPAASATRRPAPTAPPSSPSSTSRWRSSSPTSCTRSWRASSRRCGARSPDRARRAVPADHPCRGHAAVRLRQARHPLRLRDRRRHRRAARHRVQRVPGRSSTPAASCAASPSPGRSSSRARTSTAWSSSRRRGAGRASRGSSSRAARCARRSPVPSVAELEHRRRGRGERGRHLLLVADAEDAAVRVLGPLRLHLGERLGLSRTAGTSSVAVRRTISSASSARRRVPPWPPS